MDPNQNQNQPLTQPTAPTPNPQSIYPAATRGIGAEPPQELTAEHQKEAVQKIILRRRNSIIGILTMALLLAAATPISGKVSLENADIIRLSLFIIPLLIPPIALYVVNSLNIPEPKPYYRKWNKYVYTYGAKIIIVFAIFNLISNLISFLNPLNGFKDPGALTRTGLIIDSAWTMYMTKAWYDELPASRKVEEYYRSLDGISTKISYPF